MDEELYRLISTGLLGLIVLLLLFVIARLGKLQQRAQTSTPADVPPTEAAPPESPEAVALPVSTPEPERRTQPEPIAEPQASASGDEGPYEKDGRWWFRRDGELLVYDERSEEWVDPSAVSEAAADAPAEVGREQTVGVADAGPSAADVKPHPLEEARGWDTAPVGGTAPADATQAPIPEPVSPPGSITDVQPAVEPPPQDTASSSAGGHWKCPACGVINGSTATSCRMCFAARP